MAGGHPRVTHLTPSQWHAGSDMQGYPAPQFLPASNCVVFFIIFCFSFFKVIYIFYIIKIKSNKLSSNCGLHVINCPELSSIGWKIEWNASGTHTDVASLSSKNWHLGWGCP